MSGLWECITDVHMLHFHGIIRYIGHGILVQLGAA